MRVTFYGVRGSIATPGPSTVRYGGNTVCVEARLAVHDGQSLGLATGTVALPGGMTTALLGAYGGGATLGGALESVAYYAGARGDAFVQQVSHQ